MTDDKNINWDEMEWDDDLGEFVAKKSEENSNSNQIETKDSLGNLLQTGDSVILTRDLDVKGSSIKIKQGTKIKKIKAIDDPELIECEIGKSSIFLKTCFFAFVSGLVLAWGCLRNRHLLFS